MTFMIHINTLRNITMISDAAMLEKIKTTFDCLEPDFIILHKLIIRRSVSAAPAPSVGGCRWVHRHRYLITIYMVEPRQDQRLQTLVSHRRDCKESHVKHFTSGLKLIDVVGDFSTTVFPHFQGQFSERNHTCLGHGPNGRHQV